MVLTGVREGAYVPLATVERSGFVESVHQGALVALGPGGRIELAAGAVEAPIFPRSANKPLQLVGMLRAGLDPRRELPGELLALAQSSHDGEPFHLDGVRRILAWAGLTEADLQNTPAPTSIAQTCSGKHAAMLATCVARGWPTSTYLDPDHPLQQDIARAIADLAGERVVATGVDGCGAPVLAISLVGLARAFAAVAASLPDQGVQADGTAIPESLVAQANRQFPAWVSGTRSDVARLISGVPGLVAKDGVEGVYAAALPDGRAVALKVADGTERARLPVLAAALQHLGVGAAVLDDLQQEAVVLGHGRPVGLTRPVALSAYAVAGGA